MADATGNDYFALRADAPGPVYSTDQQLNLVDVHNVSLFFARRNPVEHLPVADAIGNDCLALRTDAPGPVYSTERLLKLVDVSLFFAGRSPADPLPVASATGPKVRANTDRRPIHHDVDGAT